MEQEQEHKCAVRTRPTTARLAFASMAALRCRFPMNPLGHMVSEMSSMCTTLFFAVAVVDIAMQVRDTTLNTKSPPEGCLKLMEATIAANAASALNGT